MSRYQLFLAIQLLEIIRTTFWNQRIEMQNFQKIPILGGIQYPQYCATITVMYPQTQIWQVFRSDFCLFSLFIWTPTLHMLVHLMVSHRSLCSVHFYSVFFLSVLRFDIFKFVDSACSNLLLNPSSDFFIQSLYISAPKFLF